MTTPAYRERRRRAKLRRRARDRDLADNLWTRTEARCPALRHDLEFAGRMLGCCPPWWSTAEGRRAWLEADRERKRARRAEKAKLRDAPTAQEAAETLIRVLSEGQPFRARKEIRRAVRGLRT